MKLVVVVAQISEKSVVVVAQELLTSVVVVAQELVARSRHKLSFSRKAEFLR